MGGGNMGGDKVVMVLMVSHGISIFRIFVCSSHGLISDDGGSDGVCSHWMRTPRTRQDILATELLAT